MHTVVWIDETGTGTVHGPFNKYDDALVWTVKQKHRICERYDIPKTRTMTEDIYNRTGIKLSIVEMTEPSNDPIL